MEVMQRKVLKQREELWKYGSVSGRPIVSACTTMNSSNIEGARPYYIMGNKRILSATDSDIYPLVAVTVSCRFANAEPC